MEEIKPKKAKAPAKPRKAAAKKTTAPAIEPAVEAAIATANGVPASNVTEIRPSYDQVAQLAHRYWKERGGQHGHHVEDWLRAEEELRGKAS